jgi:hypothetical protein
MLREILFLASGEKRALRDYTILLLAIVGFAVIGTQVTVKAMSWIVPAAQDRIGTAPRLPAQSGEVRQYTVTRSVLDDPITTGSIPALAKRDTDCRK